MKRLIYQAANSEKMPTCCGAQVYMAHTGLIGQGLNVTNGAEMSIIDDNQLVLCMTIF